MLLPLILIAIGFGETSSKSLKNAHRSPIPEAIDSTLTMTQRFSDAELEMACSIGSCRVNRQREEELCLLNRNITLIPGSPAFKHFRFFLTSLEAKEMGSNAMKLIEASKYLVEQFEHFDPQFGETLLSQRAYDTILGEFCPHKRVCCSSKYRTIDGSCNNLNKPEWGMSLTTMRRFLPPRYSDGVYSPPLAVCGMELPSPRLVSSWLVHDVDRPRIDLSLMTMVFGQFIDHDLDLTPIHVLNGDSGIRCCSPSGDFLPENELHRQCMPIAVPENDPFYGQFGLKCMDFVRSIPGLRSNCSFGYADQLNSVTHWLDGSQIYGSTEIVANKLRSFNKGQMRTRSVNGVTTLPLDPSPPAHCKNPCLIAGDVRIVEQPHLIVLHTLWLREHNRIAGELNRLNPHWDDEIIYQETRKIVIGQLTHITYNEFLPIVLGPDYMEHFGLTDAGMNLDYDPIVDPSISNEFATAAFRMGHSLIQGIIKMIGHGSVSTIYLTPKMDSDVLKDWRSPNQEFLDMFIRGLLTQPIQSADNYFSAEVSTKLFGSPFGLDLVSLNIARGRDHGIQSYIKYRKICSLPEVVTFEDLAPIIAPPLIKALKEVYSSVNDIDLYVGGLHEQPVPGALVGPTFACIIGDQFTRLKRADRFFYDLDGQPHSFRSEQLAEIRKSNLARIICDNSDGTISQIHPSVLHMADEQSEVSCNSPDIPKLDLSWWVD